MQLGVCYYPEHWPEARWADDARRMRAMGLTRVRIGEFAWSRVEPEPGRFDWDWLDRAVATLAGEGLGIVMGTPTATPPRWMVDAMPEMIATDANSHPRHFGSRRHYCFSHQGYRAEAVRIATLFADRYGTHPAVVAWQIDNEYGCHDTAISYSRAAAAQFQQWLRSRYCDVAALNAAWGNMFWSMDYPRFDAIGLPNLTVTEPNPAHVMDFRRFSSDQVVAFNRAQADVIRAASPGRDIVHNYMGFFTQFDHHDVSQDLDVASWDSYPLGFLEQFGMFTDAEKLRYARTGHPDIAAFHHDLYRGMTGRLWVMEQQPGPVNWARHNPAPLAGMVRLWTLEAMAHGAELVSYFRWRQAPFAQEQMHSGLLRPDSITDVGGAEARAAADDLDVIGAVGDPPQSVALVFSYPADWVFDTQPQGRSVRYLDLVFAMYTGLRRLGLDIDVVAADSALDGYAMVVVPSLPMMDAAFVARLSALDCPVLVGPRSGSKTTDFAIPPALAPGPLQALIPLRVVRVESLRDGLVHRGDDFEIARWIEHVETILLPEIATTDGIGIVYAQGLVRYLCGWPDAALLERLFMTMATQAGLQTTTLPADLRIRRAGDHVFAFNFGPEAIEIATQEFVIGSANIAPAGVSVWRTSSYS
jgi:beta-galactosidase